MMKDFKQKNGRTKRRKEASQEIPTITKLEASDAGNHEPLDNFTDFLYWREPIGDLNLDEILMPSGPKKTDDNDFIDKDKLSKGESNFEGATVISNLDNVKVKPLSSKRKPKTSKKQNSQRIISDIPPCKILSENNSKEIGKFTFTRLQEILSLF